MKNIKSIKYIALALTILFSQKAVAQLTSCNVFLQGQHIEVGVNWNGAYGSSVATPGTGYCGHSYHPKGPAGEGNSPSCGGACYTGGQNLGFVADPDKDGWGVGLPYTYYGDYFLPGSPQEGWCIQGDTSIGWAFNDGGCGTVISANITGSNVSYTTAGKRIFTTWTGQFDSMQVTQVTTLDTSTVFFTVYMTIRNLGHIARKNIYYLRTLDPDNAEPETFNFSTYNRIEYQMPNPETKVLVSATGEESNGDTIQAAFLGLGTKDCRAKCFIHLRTGLEPTTSHGSFTLEPTLDSMYNGNASQGGSPLYLYKQDSSYTSDVGISLAFKLGDIDPNDSTTFAYAYILRKGDIDSAFASTAQKWVAKSPSDSFPHVSGDTVGVCVGDTIPISILNGAAGYKWTWISPTGNHLADTAGTTNVVTIDSGLTIVWAIGKTAACAADTQVITLWPFNPPPPIVTNNGPLCIGDTLKLGATGIPNSYFAWKGPNGFFNQNPFTYRYNVQPEDSGLYYVLDSSVGCPPRITGTNVIVDAVIAKISSDKPDACVGADFTAYFSGRTPDTNSHFKWDFDNTQPIAGGPGDTNRGPYTLRWDSIGTKYIKLRVQNWRCVSTTIDTVPIIFAPPVNFDLPHDACVNDSFSAAVADYSLVGADSLEWDLHGGTVLRDGNQNLNGVMHGLYSTPGTKTVTLKIDYLLCKGAPYSATLNVHALPDAHIAPLTRDVCEGDTVTFTADANIDYRYSWQPARQLHDTLPGENVANMFIPTTGKIWVIVTDQYGCKNTDTMDVPAKVCCQVSFPSAFTPNGDGRNDYFKPITMGNHHVNYFRIVNRYGQIVFESNDEKRGWDGRLFGAPQDMDTYFWIFSYNCNGRTIEEKGDVILVR
jgi:gliding motility-associated-like protein